MKLSDIKTADQLILALASAGYRKAQPSNGPIQDPEPGPFYVYGYWAAEQPVPEISIYPQQGDLGTEWFLSAVIGKTGNILRWELNEAYDIGLCVGFTPSDETVDADSVAEILNGFETAFFEGCY